MSLGEKIIKVIEARRNRLKLTQPGPHGDFYRNGGNELLYDIPIKTGDLVLDIGGFEGDWTKKVFCRYGCRCEIYEPIPEFASSLEKIFSCNSMVNVHTFAVGNENRFARYASMKDGTSEYLTASEFTLVEVKDISDILEELNEPIACLKLNIEGGEYDVLERLIYDNKLNLFRCLLIQFHSQPKGWEARMKKIKNELAKCFDCEWSYELVWEKWVSKNR